MSTGSDTQNGSTTENGSNPQSALLGRYQASHLGVFGLPQLVVDRGEGVYLWDIEGTRYLDLLSGIAVNALGHNHPELVAAISKQAAESIHVSNFFTTVPQIELAEKLLEIAQAPSGSGVFFANSGTEAIEAAIKLSRRTGRHQIVAVEGSFHGRSTGALALTYKAAYREPFEPLIPGITHVPAGDIAALRAAVSDETAMVIMEPIQGEAGVHPLPAEYLQAARELTTTHGALLVIDEIQTGIARTGAWLAHTSSGITPDAITLAKGLGGGVPIGALVTYGAQTTSLLEAGQHGTTFGGNPLACASALAVLNTIESESLLAHVQSVGAHLTSSIESLDHPAITQVRGHGLLQAIEFSTPIAAQLAVQARAAGFIINPVTPSAIRLAPPLIITDEQLSTFVDALPELIRSAS